MRKVLMSGFRINHDLFSRLQIFLTDRGMTLTEALEKSLSFLLSSPHEVLKFKGKLFLSPESSLNRIRNNGILSREELVFIVTHIQKAYAEASPSILVNASWVGHLAAVFRLMLPCLSKGSRRALNPEFLRRLPAYGHGTEAKIENIAPYLSHCDRVLAGYANNLSKCLLILLLDGRYELSDEVLKKIKLHLEPWCFGVAKRGLSDPPSHEMVNLDLLGKEVNRSEGDHFTLKKGKVMQEVFLSKGPAYSFGWRREFRCEYFFPGKAAIPFNFNTFHDLLQCLGMFKEGKGEEATAGTITLYVSPESPRIRLGATITLLTPEEFGEFVDLTWELYNREDVQADLVKEYVKNYGTL